MPLGNKIWVDYVIFIQEGEKSELAGDRKSCAEMMGLIGVGNNPMVGMTVAVAVAIEEASK